ncbi:L-lactate permease [Streptomyces sp. LBL]|nr:L-lactate permease [Streptomyces sp. LBL]
MPARLRGTAFAVAQFAASNHLSAQLADIGAALAGVGALVAVPHARTRRLDDHSATARRTVSRYGYFGATYRTFGRAGRGC